MVKSMKRLVNLLIFIGLFKNMINNSTINELKELSNKSLSDSECTHGLGRSLRGLLKEISLYENYLSGKKKMLESGVSFDFSRIQIGGGSHMLTGYVNIDIVPPADIVWDVREGIPVPDSVCDYLFTEHFLEHIDYPRSVKKVVADLFRIMKIGGKVVVGVPDSEMAAKSYVNKDYEFKKKAMELWYSKRNCLEDFNTDIDLLNYHFRDQDDDPKYNPHMWAYDFEKLTSLLKDVGFKSVDRWQFDPTIANPKREWGSVYVIAIK